MTSQTVYKKRRNLFFQDLDSDDSLAIIFAGDLTQKYHDGEFPFVVDKNFYYLTGVTDPGSCLLLFKDNKNKIQQLFFVPENNAIAETWTGAIPGVAGYKTKLKTKSVFDIKKIEEQIILILEEIASRTFHPRIFTNATTFSNPKYRKTKAEFLISQSVNKFQPKRRFGRFPIAAIEDANIIIQENRLFKDSSEIANLVKASDINVKAHKKVQKNIFKFKNEREVQALIEYEFLNYGASGPAYDSICGAGNNSTVLHYTQNNCSLKNKQLILIDAGCEYNGYASDITRTYPLTKKISPQAQNILSITLDTHLACLDGLKIGKTLLDIHKIAVSQIITGLKSIGLLTGTKKQIIDDESYMDFFPHGIGHWIGLDVHDPCPYTYEGGKKVKIDKGCAFTIEPGIYISEKNKNVPKEYRGLGARFEDTVVVNNRGKIQNLTNSLNYKI